MQHHGAALRKVAKDDGLVEAVQRDYREASISDADRKMLDYAVLLARTPEDVSEEDVDHLRQAGFDDGQILDIAQVTAYYSFVNRIAQGLGVETEDYWNRSTPS